MSGGEFQGEIRIPFPAELQGKIVIERNVAPQYPSDIFCNLENSAVLLEGADAQGNFDAKGILRGINCLCRLGACCLQYRLISAKSRELDV